MCTLPCRIELNFIYLATNYATYYVKPKQNRTKFFHVVRILNCWEEAVHFK